MKLAPPKTFFPHKVHANAKHPFSADHANKMHDRASAVAGAVTAQPIHMIYQENVADNRTKGMTYAALKAPLTRLDVESPFTDSPSLDGRIDHPARIYFGSRFVVPKHLLIVAFRVDTTLGGSGFTALWLATRC